MELSELLLLLSLIGGTIYASVSLTIQVLEYWKKKRTDADYVSPSLLLYTVTTFLTIQVLEYRKKKKA